MTVRFTALLMSVLLTNVLAACGGDLYVDKSYRYAQSTPPRLAIVPLPPHVGRATDEAFSKSFGKTSHRETVVLPESLRQRIGASNSLRDTLNKISKSELKEFSNLKGLLSEAELVTLRDQLGPADLMLIPVTFEITSTVGLTLGQSKFRLYDLHTGSLIYENSKKLNVNRVGEEGVLLMSYILIGLAKSDFDTNFVNDK